MDLENNQVAMIRSAHRSYPTESPFHPAEAFPEYAGQATEPNNPVYGLVRGLLAAPRWLNTNARTIASSFQRSYRPDRAK